MIHKKIKHNLQCRVKILGCYGILLFFSKISIAVPVSCGTNQTQAEVSKGSDIFNTGKRFAFSQKLRAGRNYALGEKLHRGTKYLRFSIKSNDKLTGEQWKLVIRDTEQRVIQILEPADFPKSETVVWTTRIYGSKANFEFESNNKELFLIVSEFIAMPKETSISYYSVQKPGVPSYSDLYSNDKEKTVSDIDGKYKRRGNSVGLLMSSYGTQSWTCSGVVVGDDLFLTNWHCGAPSSIDEPWFQGICDSSLIDLSWDNDDISRDYQCVKTVAKSKELDFALLKVKPLRDARTPPAVLITGKSAEIDNITIIHHPEGDPKKISMNCSVVNVESDSPMDAAVDTHDFEHNCDTAVGSSGAPVFNSSGALIGLHHLGFALNDDKTECDNLNKAVWMEEIVNDIKSQAPDEAKKLNYQVNK